MHSQFCASKTLSRTQKSPWIEHPAGLCFGAITRLQVRKQRRLGALAQENVVFGPTVLAHGAFKKPGNPNGLPGFFRVTIHAKLPGRPLAVRGTAATASHR